jgi:hypothetical protein
MPDALTTPTRSWWTALRDLIRGWFGGYEAPDEAAPTPVTSGLPALEPLAARSDVPRAGEHVRICVDFGTSTSTVARAILGGEPELAVLQADPRTGRRVRTIDSDIAWASGEPAVLGAVARLLEERQTVTGEYHRSLKRMLSDLRRDDQSHLKLRLRVEPLIEELLRLSLDPAASGTVRRQAELTGVAVAELAGQLGLPDHEALRKAVATGTLDLYLCVPNAFGNFEEEVLRGAAWEAAVRFQRDCAESLGVRRTDEAVAVRLIREAEAVAWWVLHEDHLRGRQIAAHDATWLVFDVGAGSTDAAVVSVRTGDGRGQAPEVRTDVHSGAVFGGHDVDELFLHATAERAGEGHPDAIERRIAAAKTTRALQLRAFSDGKEAWSAEFTAALAGIDVDRLLRWIEAPDGPMPGAETIPPFRPGTELWPVREVTGFQFGPDYARFLRGTVVGVLAALGAARPNAKLERVILSGRGALLPGVAPLVARKLVAMGWIASPSQVALVDGGDPERLKLACVLGIAVAAAHRAVPDELSQTLSEEVSFGRAVPLWPRGARLQDSAVRAGLRLEGADGARLVGFYQYRCPREVADAIGAGTPWEHRHLGAAQLHLFEPLELLASFDTKTGQLGLWRVIDGDCVPVPLEVEPVYATGENPISRMPFGWVDA